MQPLPPSAILTVPRSLANNLYAAAQTLPVFANESLYDITTQLNLFRRMEAAVQGPFQQLLKDIKGRLHQQPFTVLVRGLQFDEEHRLLVALNRGFGNLVAKPYHPEHLRDRLIHYIQPRTDISVKAQTQTERLHTDCADWPELNGYLSMQCVRPDDLGGGRSRLLDCKTLRGLLAKELDSEELQRLEEPVPWQVAPYCGGGVVWRPILGADELRWRRYTIDQAIQSEGITLSQVTLEAIDHFGEILNTTDNIMEFSMESGDFLIMDNRRCVHARSPISDTKTQRLMLRAWMQA